MPTSMLEPKARPTRRPPADRAPHTDREVGAAPGEILEPTLLPKAGYAPIPLRLVLGGGMLYHGLPKVFTEAGHAQFVGMLDGIGIPLAGVVAWIVALVEVVGGISLLLGSMTRLFASLLVVDMVVAMFTVHLPHGFNFMNITGTTDAGPVFGMPGYEVNLLYIAGLLALLLAGPGRWAFDTGRRQHQEAIEAMPGGVIQAE